MVCRLSLQDLTKGSLQQLLGASGIEQQSEALHLGDVAKALGLGSLELTPREAVADADDEDWEDAAEDPWGEQLQLLQCMYPPEADEGAHQVQPDRVVVASELPWIEGTTGYLVTELTAVVTEAAAAGVADTRTIP